MDWSPKATRQTRRCSTRSSITPISSRPPPRPRLPRHPPQHRRQSPRSPHRWPPHRWPPHRWPPHRWPPHRWPPGCHWRQIEGGRRDSRNSARKFRNSQILPRKHRKGHPVPAVLLDRDPRSHRTHPGHHLPDRGRRQVPQPIHLTLAHRPNERRLLGRFEHHLGLNAMPSKPCGDGVLGPSNWTERSEGSSNTESQ